MLKIGGLKYGNLRRIEKGGLLWIGLMGILATGKAQQLPVDMERPVDAAGEVAVDRSALVVPDALPLFLVLTGDDSFGARRQNPDAWLEFRKTHYLPFSAAAEALACVRDTTKNGTMAPDIQVHRSLSWSTGSSEFFTGEVRVQRFEAPAPARVRASKVTFAPGARTAWHSHPLGQILIVTPCAALGWSDSRNFTWRRGLDSPWREALAWGHAKCTYDPYCHCGSARGRGGHVDGVGYRGAVSRSIKSIK